MNYLSVAAIAKIWGLSERSVRNYCSMGRIPGAFLTGKTWNVPADAVKPGRAGTGSHKLLPLLKNEAKRGVKDGLYRRILSEMTYHSCRMEGTSLPYEQVVSICRDGVVIPNASPLSVNDIIAADLHCRAMANLIGSASSNLTEKTVRTICKMFSISLPASIPHFPALLTAYHMVENKSLDDLLEFHHQFISIIPDGRVTRLILFRECLHAGITPFIIEADMKPFYMRGLEEWPRERDFLRETCLTAQENFQALLDEYRVL